MLNNFRPMLATEIDFNKINPEGYYVVSPKLDGIRVLVNNGNVYTRSMKLLPNKHIAEVLSKWSKKCVEGYWFDGEIIVGEPTDPMCYRKTTSIAMSEDKIVNDWWFCAFDCVSIYDHHSYGAWYRFNQLEGVAYPSDRVKIVPHKLVKGYELKSKCDELLESKYEGAMISPDSALYKYGRATPKSMELMKYKAWTDDEAVVMGVVQKEKNMNEATINELGNTQRSSHKSGKVLVDEVGALVVAYKGSQFNIGSGFTEEERKRLWVKRDKLLGKLVKFKFTQYGEYEVPRFPVFIGFRDKRDL